ncbi:ABC-2 family transporter protein [Verrucomicrobia bacterium]|nr:ABC-2 family transporter protein [Verrucomicrobiota bacterium]
MNRLGADGMNTFSRYRKIYGELWRNSVIREMQFKVNFLLWIVVELLWFSLQLAFISVIYMHTESIGSWTKWEVVLLVGTSHLIQQIFSTFILNNLTALSEHIRTGRLDFMLLLPVNTRFLVSLRQVDLGGILNGMASLGVITYACFKMSLIPGALEIVLFFGLCLVGVLIHWCLMSMLAAISFWSVKANGLVWGYYNMFQLARMPDEAFTGLFSVFFRLVIPMLLVANVPVRVIADKLRSPIEVVTLLVMAGCCYLVSTFFWRLSIRRYTSASS